jgi:hypothetical protein
MSVYGTSTIKQRQRRTATAIRALQDLLYTVVERDQPMSNRQAFYRMVSAGAIAKTENDYRFICRQLVLMRRDARLPYAWISDNTRWIRRVRTYRSVEALLLETARTYRRTLWDASSTHVEIWCESDSIASVLSTVTYQWDVPLMVFRGYSSEGYLYTLGEEIKRHQRPTFIYYFGDYDPSGVDIPRAALTRVQEFAPEADLTFTRVAVTPDQIAQWQLLTRPPKQADPRSKKFRGEAVEIEAIPSPQLRTLVERAITSHLDPHQLGVIATAEASERQLLEWFASSVPYYQNGHII